MILSLLLASARLKAEVPRDFRLLLLHFISPRLEDVPFRQLCLVCWSVCTLAHNHDDLTNLRAGSEHALLPRIEHLSSLYLSRSHPAAPPNVIDLYQLLTSFSLVAYKPSDDWMELHEHHCYRMLHQGQLKPELAFKMAEAYRGLEYRPSSLLDALRAVVDKTVVAGMEKRRREESWREGALLNQPSEVHETLSSDEDEETHHHDT